MRSSFTTAFALAVLASLSVAAWADDDDGEGGEGMRSARASGVDPTYAKECGACHVPFPASFLPARSWTAITGDLPNHFGEDASLDPATVDTIRSYLVANAADTVGARGPLRGLDATDTPLRITQTPFWIRIHKGEVRETAFTSPKVKSKANCAACHRGAAAGLFDDD